ncbi:hypothetical protein AVEN_9240-1, partial [Araneus ventricosus]
MYQPLLGLKYCDVRRIFLRPPPRNVANSLLLGSTRCASSGFEAQVDDSEHHTKMLRGSDDMENSGTSYDDMEYRRMYPFG